MAKYIYVEQIKMFTYALDECEDYLVMDAYLDLKNSGLFTNEMTLKKFEYYHLQEGATLNDNIMMQMNGLLRRIEQQTLPVFVNGHTTVYAHMRGYEKAQRREQMLARLKDMSPERREDFISLQRSMAELLPERKPAAPMPLQNADPALERAAETERRRAALVRQRTVEQLVKPVVPVVADGLPPNEDDEPFVLESTMQDNVVEVLSEMKELRNEVATLKAMLSSIFRAAGEVRC